MPPASSTTTILRRRATRFWLRQVVAWCLGGLFIFAGWQKALDPAQFVTAIRGFHLLPDPGPALLALSLPWLEIFAGLAVLTGWLRRGGLLIINLSLLVFLIALLSAWARGINVDCGCFGGAQPTTLAWDIVRDLVLLIAGLRLWFTEPRTRP